MPKVARSNREPILTPTQVGALLQVHVKTVYRLAAQGLIPGIRIGRRWRFNRTDIVSLVSKKHARLLSTR